MIVELANRPHHAIADVGDQREVELAIHRLPRAQIVIDHRVHAAQVAIQRLEIAIAPFRSGSNHRRGEGSIR